MKDRAFSVIEDGVKIPSEFMDNSIQRRVFPPLDEETLAEKWERGGFKSITVKPVKELKPFKPKGVIDV